MGQLSERQSNVIRGRLLRELREETVTGDVTSIRQGWDSHEVARFLDPTRLATLLRAALQEDARDYLTLAEEIEERDLFYRSQISTRKLAAQGIAPQVTPASEDAADVEIAAAVKRDIVDRPAFRPMLFDLLDGIAKGYSATEVTWETEEGPWRPKSYHHRDPRWFCYDRETARDLRLLDQDGYTLHELQPYKWVVHEPPLKAGIPIRAGLARPVAYYHLIKTYDVASWVAFVEVFGYPIRIGKYGKDATAADITVLKKAVENLGRDVGAVIPDAMMMEIIGGVAPGAGTEHFHELARFANNEIAIGVNGQLASTEGTPGRLGNDEAQDKVRRDILVADGQHLELPINRDLVVPYVDLNYGRRQAYPWVGFPVPDEEDLKQLVEAVSKLVPVGLRVRAADIRERFRLGVPADDDEVLELPAAAQSRPAGGGPPALNARGALNAAGAADDDIAELLAGERWQPVLGPIHDALNRLAEESGSFEELERRLPELLAGINANEAARRLAAAALQARGLGDRDFRSGE